MHPTVCATLESVAGRLRTSYDYLPPALIGASHLQVPCHDVQLSQKHRIESPKERQQNRRCSNNETPARQAAGRSHWLWFGDRKGLDVPAAYMLTTMPSHTGVELLCGGSLHKHTINCVLEL